MRIAPRFTDEQVKERYGARAASVMASKRLKGMIEPWHLLGIALICLFHVIVVSLEFLYNHRLSLMEI